jgi:hypothetical protein
LRSRPDEFPPPSNRCQKYHFRIHRKIGIAAIKPRRAITPDNAFGTTAMRRHVAVTHSIDDKYLLRHIQLKAPLDLVDLEGDCCTFCAGRLS